MRYLGSGGKAYRPAGAAGRALLAASVPIWKQTHAIVEKLLPRANCEELRADLRVLS